MKVLRLAPVLGLLPLVACESTTEVSPEITLRMEAAIQPTWDGTVPYLVAAEDGLPANLADLVSAHDGVLRSTIPGIGVAVVDSDSPGFLKAMAAEDGIEFVVPDGLEELPATPHATADGLTGDAFGDRLLWGMKVINAPEAWAAGARGAGVRVAVLDAGINHDHPDLAPNLNSELSTSYVPCLEGLVPDEVFDPAGDGNCDGPVEDWRVHPGFYFNHGTHVSGTIAATGDVGVTGVAPDAELVAVKVCTEWFYACFTSAIVQGLIHSADIDADVVNMSLGETRRMRNDFVKFCADLGLDPQFCAALAGDNAQAQSSHVANTIKVYRRAFQYAFDMGTTVVVAAGNGATDFDRSQDIWYAFADFPHVIGVSATGPRGWCADPANTDVDEPAYYTNTGRSIIDVAAPGGNFGPVESATSLPAPSRCPYFQ